MITRTTRRRRSRRTPCGEDQADIPGVGPIAVIPGSVVTELAEVCRLMADETRLRILLCLMRTDELHVRALCELLGQRQSAVSHHLALLRVAGLIDSRRDGKHNYYRVLSRRFGQILQTVFSAAPHDKRRIRCEDYVLNYLPSERPE